MYMMAYMAIDDCSSARTIATAMLRFLLENLDDCAAVLSMTYTNR